ncbi:glycosyltransferase family 2 protein [Pseudanabaena sp. UWO310]|uniref:glycosyltransferase family 2 protein n=1 Tax=Pseudanabaena sp. UWO310 TaxID=2480795 RepID=UPI00116153E9|nr:glycosyltransferase family 2 protein [Pseudanabaena sp. UWO310]TYQ24020.1 glycosyltransferase family 2 protein [Pseudanabaena sp. UWO310]
MPCSTAVVFFIFRRPDLTARVFDVIRQAQPTRLFIVADGSRNENEEILCQRTREITEKIDWNCEVSRNYSDINLGCRDRIYSGINWVFEYVDEAIILEDDCLPHLSFFQYCETLLKYYRDDQRVMTISGSNFQDGNKRTPYSYYFSKYPHSWGWATWRRAWKHCDLHLENWLEFTNSGLLKQVFSDEYEQQYWYRIFERMWSEQPKDIWDYMWIFSCWSQSGLTILPNVNLISNIGFGKDATHTYMESHLANMEITDIGIIRHSPFVVRHVEADCYTFDHVFGGKAIKELARKNNSFIGKTKSKIRHLGSKFKSLFAIRKTI